MLTQRTVLAFIVYGAVLCLCGVAVAGFGHGTYTLLGLAGSPFSALGAPVAMIAALTQWGLLAVARQRYGLHFGYVIAFLAFHYAVAVFLLCPASGFADWERVAVIPQSYQVVLALGFGWYLLGQAFLWRTLRSKS